MNKRAVIYARVSDDSQRQNYSIPVQIEACMKYAQERDYVIVGDWFVDPITGYDVKSDTPHAVQAYADDHTSLELMRPGINALTNFLKTSGADVVIVYILNRLARDSYIRQTLERQFEALGARIEYVLGQYDDEYGEIRKDLDSTFAKWENIERVRRSREGKERKARSGKFVAGPAPYGYVYDKESPSGLVIVEEQKVVVERIFTLYVVERESIRGIVRILNQENIPSPTGKKWGRSTIGRILAYKGYTGNSYYNKSFTRQTLDGRQIRSRDRSEWIEIPIPPIISEYLFQQAQKRLKENSKHLRREPKKGRFYLLRGLIFCAVCEKPYICQAVPAGKNRRLRPSLIYRHRKQEGHCMNAQISAASVEGEVWDKLVGLIMKPEKLIDGYKRSHDQSRANLRQKQEYLQTLLEKRDKLIRQKSQLNIMYSDVDLRMTKEEFMDAKLILDQALDEVTEQVAETEAEIISLPTPADLETFADFTAEIREYLLGNIDPPPADKRRMLELLDFKVLVNEDKAFKITGSFPQNGDEDGLSPSVIRLCPPAAATSSARFTWS